MQVTGSEILQRAVYLAQKTGVQVCCTVHDALLIEAPIDDMAHHAWLAKEAMRQASADILSGFELFIDGWGEEKGLREFIVYPQHYRDKRGNSTWAKIQAMCIRDHRQRLVIPESVHSALPLEAAPRLGKRADPPILLGG